jgi:multidrug efflux pump subunit AcrA (membrane-fusion protein)
MKAFRLVTLIGLNALAAFMVMLALTGCGKATSGKPTPPPVAVTVEAVTNQPFVRLLTVTGTIEPTTVAGLASPAEGPVLDCRVREGDRVTAGQELLSIGRQLSAEAAQASAREEVILSSWLVRPEKV